jgi:protein TonB
VVKEVKAEYTEEAKQNRIEGNVGLGAVVLADGKVGDVGVEESLDSIYGLDKNAVAAMKQWVFKPGVKDGKPVAVRIHVQMAFTLK